MEERDSEVQWQKCWAGNPGTWILLLPVLLSSHIGLGLLLYSTSLDILICKIRWLVEVDGC